MGYVLSHRLDWEKVSTQLTTGFLFFLQELRDDVSFDTLDILRDPKVAAEHIELQ